MCAARCNVLQYFLGGFGFAGSRFSRNQHTLISKLASHRPVRRITNCKSLREKYFCTQINYIFFSKKFTTQAWLSLTFFKVTFSQSRIPIKFDCLRFSTSFKFHAFVLRPNDLVCGRNYVNLFRRSSLQQVNFIFCPLNIH